MSKCCCFSKSVYGGAVHRRGSDTTVAAVTAAVALPTARVRLRDGHGKLFVSEVPEEELSALGDALRALPLIVVLRDGNRTSRSALRAARERRRAADAAQAADGTRRRRESFAAAAGLRERATELRGTSRVSVESAKRFVCPRGRLDARSLSAEDAARLAAAKEERLRARVSVELACTSCSIPPRCPSRRVSVKELPLVQHIDGVSSLSHRWAVTRALAEDARCFNVLANRSFRRKHSMRGAQARCQRRRGAD